MKLEEVQNKSQNVFGGHKKLFVCLLKLEHYIPDSSIEVIYFLYFSVELSLQNEIMLSVEQNGPL